MQCPACSGPLTTHPLGAVTVDACRGGCGGLWFDRLELKRLDDQHEAIGDSLTDVGDGRAVDHDARRRCPSCDAGHVMMRRLFAPGLELEIDECPGCGGIWLDRGELAAVRSAGGEAARRTASKAAYQQLFNHQVQEARVKSENEGAKSKTLARLLWFICPSAWLEGKQDWGAF